MGNHPWVRIPPLPPHTKTPKGVFWYVAEGVCGRAHSGSTDSSGTNLDSRRAGPERAARRVRPKDGPNISHPFRQIPKPRKGFFGMWRKGVRTNPLGFDALQVFARGCGGCTALVPPTEKRCCAGFGRGDKPAGRIHRTARADCIKVSTKAGRPMRLYQSGWLKSKSGFARGCEKAGPTP